MSERQPGWYWVMFCDRWTMAEWIGEGYDHWECSGMEGSVPESCFTEIGDRVPAPDEPWKVVPEWETLDMIRAGMDQVCQGTFDISVLYREMVRAAPKPGDGDE